MDSSVTAKATDAELANSIRALSMDAVEAAKSGHPGMPMGMAEIAVALWTRHLRHNPGNPNWPNRDRFVLSNGHGSMLLYSLLHLTGYALPIEELKRFRQLGSKTPGHPERRFAPGVESQDLEAFDGAIRKAKRGAKRSPGRPTLICAKTVIAKGAPAKANPGGAHGAPLGDKEVAATRAAIGWPYPPFQVPPQVYQRW